tara:strand:+ start:1057 stop:1236 length:180 start_codon:yes stop_codon:yes gene_type:complete
MKIKEFTEMAIKDLEVNGMSTRSDDVCNYLHDNYDWKLLGFTLNDIFYKSRWYISKLRS